MPSGVLESLQHEYKVKRADQLLQEDALHHQAETLANRLFLSLSPFFQKPQTDYHSLLHSHHQLMSLKSPAINAPPDLPTTISQQPLPGTTSFPTALITLFTTALTTRLNLIRTTSSTLFLHLPSFKQPYQPSTQANEEYHLDSTNLDASGRPRWKTTDLGKRVFVTTMFGISMRWRERWSEPLGEEQRVTRAAVFMLD